MDTDIIFVNPVHYSINPQVKQEKSAESAPPFRNLALRRSSGGQKKMRRHPESAAPPGRNSPLRRLRRAFFRKIRMLQINFFCQKTAIFFRKRKVVFRTNSGFFPVFSEKPVKKRKKSVVRNLLTFFVTKMKNSVFRAFFLDIFRKKGTIMGCLRPGDAPGTRIDRKGYV